MTHTEAVVSHQQGVEAAQALAESSTGLLYCSVGLLAFALVAVLTVFFVVRNEKAKMRKEVDLRTSSIIDMSDD